MSLNRQAVGGSPKEAGQGNFLQPVENTDFTTHLPTEGGFL